MNATNMQFLYDLYWLAMPVVTVFAVLFAFWRKLRRVLGFQVPPVPGLARSALAVASNALAIWALERWLGAVSPVIGILIDLGTMAIIAWPPRSHFQGALAALFFCQICVGVLSSLANHQGASGYAVPIWFMMNGLNLAQLVALLLWIGGSHAGIRADLLAFVLRRSAGRRMAAGDVVHP